MREFSVEKLTEHLKEMSMEANFVLSSDIKDALLKHKETEESPIGRSILEDIIKNYKLAEDKSVPMCQDTGMAVVFLEVGQDVHFVGGDVTEAINQGIRQGYEAGFLRKSVVKDPLLRENTKDNTPAIVHFELVLGQDVKITLAPKGFGSENMSRSIMLKPSDGIKGVKEFIVETVKLAGPNPCPPIVIGVGIGGTLEKAALIAKKALVRPINESSPLAHIKTLEEETLEVINKLGIGPQGLGGTTTALGLNIEVFPTHIAGLPVVVNINCHAARHVERIL